MSGRPAWAAGDLVSKQNKKQNSVDSTQIANECTEQAVSSGRWIAEFSVCVTLQFRKSHYLPPTAYSSLPFPLTSTSF